jgi:hypothetical protein
MGKKLLLSIEDLKALGIIKKRKQMKNKKRKKGKTYENSIYGIKTESQHMTGFGGQVNPQNDLQNELIRQQMKALQNDQNIRNDQHHLMIEDNRFSRNEYYPRIEQLERNQNLLINKSQQIVKDIYSKFAGDNIDVAKTGGSDFFNTEGIPIPENDNVNQNFADYVEQKVKAEIPMKPKRMTRRDALVIARQVKASKKAKEKAIKEQNDALKNV